MTTGSVNWIHMVGIGGAGMSGIAQVLSERGFKVSGSDLQNNRVTDKLKQMGIKVYEGHSSLNIREGIDLLVISSAIPMDNEEVQAARGKHIPVIKRGQMLAQLVNGSRCIAVAGAHGKTTTTSMIYLVLNACGLDPTFIVGGELQGTQTNAKLGRSEFCVIEADESDASFLDLRPYIAVVTNIEDDHLDYYKSFNNIKNAFVKFLDGVKKGGVALVYGGDECINTIKNLTNTRVVTYGESESHDYYLKNWHPKEMGGVFDVYAHGVFAGSIEIAVPGKHNALNALAAAATALEMGLDFTGAAKALQGFMGAKRRFEISGRKNNITVVDDYAHHPTEIMATIEAARNFHRGRVVVIFQPHRYTRTQALGEKLGTALQAADVAIITDIYSAGEKCIPGVSSKSIYDAARKGKAEVCYIPSFHEIVDFIAGHSRENDLIITMGAGDVWKLGNLILERI